MFACSNCESKFTERTHFLQHMTNFHQNQSKFICAKNCRKSFSSYDSFRKHLRTTHILESKEIGFHNLSVSQVDFKTSNAIESIDGCDSNDKKGDLTNSKDNLLVTDHVSENISVAENQYFMGIIDDLRVSNDNSESIDVNNSNLTLNINDIDSCNTDNLTLDNHNLSVHSESNINENHLNFDTDSLKVNTDNSNVNINILNASNDSVNVNTDSLKVNTDGLKINTDSLNVNTDSLNGNTNGSNAHADINIDSSNHPKTDCNSSNSTFSNVNFKNQKLEYATNNLQFEVVMYAAKMHNYTDLCRKRAQDVMNDSKNLYSKINSELEKEIIECISSNNTDKKALLEQVENIFSKKKKYLLTFQQSTECSAISNV